MRRGSGWDKDPRRLTTVMLIDMWCIESCGALSLMASGMLFDSISMQSSGGIPELWMFKLLLQLGVKVGVVAAQDA